MTAQQEVFETPPPLTSYSPKKTAIFLDCSESTIFRMIRNGQLNSFKFGGTRRITAEEIARIQNQH